MAAPNRVDAMGEVVSSGLRCQWMGNRGCLHEGREIVRPWRSKAWITCQTDFRGRTVEQWAPGRYTVLFFHDEAVALAAGHRPCAECRRADYLRFLDAWEKAHGIRPRAPELDAALHDDRRSGQVQRTYSRPWADIPDGVFVKVASGPAVVLGSTIVPWSSELGYLEAEARPSAGDVEVLTPRLTVGVLEAGYMPQVGATAA